MLGGYGQFSYGCNYWGPTGNNRDDLRPRAQARRTPRAVKETTAWTCARSFASVFHLDKCLGCHTCTSSARTSGPTATGAEYMWWNNVETRPGTGLPAALGGPGPLEGRLGGRRRGPRCGCRHGGRRQLATDLPQPDLPTLDDYYEPWTYRYGTSSTRPRPTAQPARPRSRLTGGRWTRGGPELGRRPRRARCTPDGPRRSRRRSGGALRRSSGSPLPPAAHVQPLPEPGVRGGLPFRRDLQARRGRARPRRPGQVPRLADVRLGLPVQEGPLQLELRGKAEKCIGCYPRIETGEAPACFEACVGRIRYQGVLLYDADAHRRPPPRARRGGPRRGAARAAPRPARPRACAQAAEAGIPHDCSRRRAARRSTRW